MTNENKQGKIRVGVVFGGKSGEHEVSLASARSVMSAMDTTKYEIYPIGIDKSGRWLTRGDPMALLSDQADELPQLDASESARTGDNLPAPAKGRELVPGTSRQPFPNVDVVFPVLHGTLGEDGTVQGLLELANLPYVGAAVLGSALGMDKAAQKAVLRANGIPVVDDLLVLRSEWHADQGRIVGVIEERFDYPIFVKPANMGSSVGVSKAHDRDELITSIDLAARFDRRILVERAVNAREIECAVLGNDDPIASIPGEVVPCHEFYDYSAKYVEEDSELHIPAKISAKAQQEIREIAIQAFKAIDCAGMARVDFFLDKDSGAMYINELNTIPGFTEISMYPKLWAATGIPYPELVDRLIELALERHADRQQTETSYGFDH